MENKNIIENLKWRYATKKFDNSKKLTEDQVEQLKEIISLTPTSYGMEPYKALIITDKKIREELKKYSWNQAQVTDCSHYVVFLHKKQITKEDVGNYMQRIADTRGIDKSNLSNYAGMISGDLIEGPRSKAIEQWSKNQSYIALGNTMTSLASLGIDACPMEGFDPKEYDRILGLEDSEFKSSVCLAVGFRAADDDISKLKKVRKSQDELIQII